MPGVALDILRRLVAHDTTNPPRAITGAGIFAEAAAILESAGFAFRCADLGDGCVTMLAVRGAPHTLFNVHLDTVPASDDWTGDPFALRVEGDRATGLGACDVKGAAACLLAAATTTIGPAALLLTSDEEAGASRCVRTFLDDAPPFVERVVVAEPTGCAAVTAHRGLHTCEGLFRGVAAHASGAATRSAIHDAARWIDTALSHAAAAETQRYDELHGIRLNVGVIEGGIKPNVAAPRARVVFGVRHLPNQDGGAVLAELCDLAPAEADIDWTPRFVAPALVPTDRSRALADSMHVERGGAVDFWTEAALFAEAGLPAVVFGPGDIAQAHAADEWIALEQLDRATSIYQRLLSDPDAE